MQLALILILHLKVNKGGQRNAMKAQEE